MTCIIAGFPFNICQWWLHCISPSWICIKGSRECVTNTINYNAIVLYKGSLRWLTRFGVFESISSVSFISWPRVVYMRHVIIIFILLITDSYMITTRHKATMSYGLKYCYRQTMTGGTPIRDNNGLNKNDGWWLFHIYRDMKSFININQMSIDMNYLAPILLTIIRSTSIGIMAWISNYIHFKQWDVMTHTWPNFNSSLVGHLYKLWHGWVITSHINN